MDHTKKVLVEELKVGMYIADLNAPYIDHPFIRNRFMITDEKTIKKIKDSGIMTVYIDPTKGLDEPNAPTYADVNRNLKNMMENIVADEKFMQKTLKTGQTHVIEEIPAIQKTQSMAVQSIQKILSDAREDGEIVTENAMTTAIHLADSVIRCPEAVHLIGSIKDKDDYTFQHSVSVCSLLVAFCNLMGMDKESIYSVALGGLLHDIGKSKIDDRILKKPGRLTPQEFEIMKTHVEEGRKILDKTDNIPGVSKQILYEHHERFDGTGYPQGLKGNEISKIGRIAAVCDVYDAMSSTRVYHKGLIPHEALRKIFEWSAYHFDHVIVEQFVHMMGIYPVGSLVRLESGFISVVLSQNPGSLLKPLVRTFYDSFAKRFVRPEELDLSQLTGEKIIGAVSQEDLRINVDTAELLRAA